MFTDDLGHCTTEVHKITKTNLHKNESLFSKYIENIYALRYFVTDFHICGGCNLLDESYFLRKGLSSKKPFPSFLLLVSTQVFKQNYS